MTEYKERETSLTIEDVWFNVALKTANARAGGFYDDFKNSVQSLRMTMSGVIGSSYEEVIDPLEQLYPESDYLYECMADELFKILYDINIREVDITEYIEKSMIIDDICQKLRNGIGQNLIFTGSPGSGKSWGCMRLGDEVCKKLDHDFVVKNTAFTLEHFLRLYNDKKLTPPGSALIFEEVGVNINSKDFMSKANKVFGNVFQTARHRGILIMLNTPSLGFLDKTPRMLLHWWFETSKLNRQAGYCEVKPHRVEVNQRDNDAIFPYPRFDKIKKVNRLRISKPRNELIEKYEELAKEYKDKLARDSQIIVAELNKDKDIQRDQYFNYRDQGLLQKEIIKKMGLTSFKATKYEKVYKNLEKSSID